MTKSEGIGTKTQKVLDELQGIEFQNSLLELDISKRLRVTIQYVDKKDIFERLRDIESERTISYIFDNVIIQQLDKNDRMSPEQMKELDESGFISNFLTMVIERFDNPEAPHPMKLSEFDQLNSILQTKLDRDKRKFEVSCEEDIPYPDWDFLITGDAVSAKFDVMPGFRDDFNNLTLTPLDLKHIFRNILQLVLMSPDFRETDFLFMDIFINQYLLFLRGPLYQKEGRFTIREFLAVKQALQNKFEKVAYKKTYARNERGFIEISRNLEFMKRLDIDEWDEFFCRMEHKEGYSHWDWIKVVWVDNSNKWCICYGDEILENGFETEMQALDRCEYLE
ncbi:hypothetical protein AB4Z22_34790, partial [Paenibacillus sp. TAF58]